MVPVTGAATNETILNETADLPYAERLVDLLGPKRADERDMWIEVGWCLRNIDHRLLDKWIEFSKKSDKFGTRSGEFDKYYGEAACMEVWDAVRIGNDALGFGSLVNWAKEDSGVEHVCAAMA
jgi:hypothetical protein